mgnify:CR=1 FL=1
MADINKFTAKEVLNKVLLDSSGDAVVAFSHTSQEALNAALDTTNNRLNISLKGGTIDGDVSITGDLTITGSSTYTYDEQIDGQLWLKDSTASSSTQGGHLRLFSDDGAAMAAGHRLGVIEFAGAEDASSTITVGARIEALAESTYTSSENGSALLFYTTDGNASQSEQMRITSDGNIGIGESSSVDKKIHIKSSSSGDGITLEQASTGSNTIRFEANSSALRALIGTEDSDGGSMFTNASGYAISIRSEAKIHLGTGGDNIRMTLDDNSRISLSNNDSAGTGGSDSTSGVTLLGYGAGNNIASGGVDNSFFGHGTGNRNTTGEKNSYFGNLAGFGNATGDYNTYVGYGSGWGVATNNNSNNTGVGFESLKAITTGGNNVAVGASSLSLNEDGSHNVAVGFQALRKLGDTANNNIGIGTNTLENITADGIENCIAIGFEAMRGESGSTTGINGSVAIGYRSLDEITSGAANTAVGYQSADLITTGSNNTVVGYDAEVSANSASNQTVVGKGATGQADNSVTLGNADVTAVYMAQDSGALVHTAGIQFPATFSGNAGANVLDEYEEGSHTATLTCSTSGTAALDGSNNELSYVRIGSKVTVNGLLAVVASGTSSPSGFFKISLPFTILEKAELSGRCSASVTIYGSNADVQGFVALGVEDEAFLRVYRGDATSLVNDSANALQDGTSIAISVTYFV